MGFGGGWVDDGVWFLGPDTGITELFLVSPQVMETRQVPRSPRVRLLLLLLLLVSWGHRTASGVALPPAGVFRLRTPGEARAGPATPQSRRSLALADDAAFRERARLLAALERRHWLNSYMHKLLVLDAP
uniref:Tuberoinfundibular peptide of 39 residues n=4 Tax=Bovinae TaxID=27592 RepID=A0A4W2CN21_BOBOX